MTSAFLRNRAAANRQRTPRRRLGSAALWLGLAILCSSALAQRPPEESDAPSLAGIDEVVREQMAEQGLIGLGVGAARGDKVLTLKGFGWQDREAGIPVRARRTMFRWASLSKSLTAIAAVKLAGAGVLDLDQPISAYLKDYRPPDHYVESCRSGSKPVGEATIPCRDGFFEIPIPESRRTITTRLLLGHLAGIPHYGNGKGSPVPPTALANDPNTNRGFAWALSYLYDKPLVAVPGDAMRYTTFGFDLAGEVLHKAAGKPFDELVADNVSGPLSLSTLQPDYEWKEIADRAVGYQRRGRGPVVDRQGSDDVSWKLPGGGFISTVEDLLGYCRGLSGDRFLSAGERRLLWTSQKTSDGHETSYGMGFYTRSREGRREISHSGAQQKTRTYLLLYPDESLCAVAMSNSTYADVDALAHAVAEATRTP